MATLTISDELFARLQKRADAEGRTAEAIVAELVLPKVESVLMSTKDANAELWAARVSPGSALGIENERIDDELARSYES